MAKEGNRSSGESGETKGPCADCGAKVGPFAPIARYRGSGKRKLVRLCQKCITKA